MPLPPIFHALSLESVPSQNVFGAPHSSGDSSFASSTWRKTDWSIPSRCTSLKESKLAVCIGPTELRVKPIVDQGLTSLWHNFAESAAPEINKLATPL